MNIYFPQWQGSGSGKTIETGAKAILDHLEDPSFIKVSLSNKSLEKQYYINGFKALKEQLQLLRTLIITKNPDTLKVIGGDCGLEIVPVSFLNKKYEGDLAVIWFDAHADINAPHESPSCNFHGMPLRTLLGESSNTEMQELLFSVLHPSQIHYVGLRDIDLGEQQRIDKDTIYHTKTASCSTLTKTLKSKKLKNLYLHFDVDVLNPLDYDKTYYQVADGISIQDAEHCIEELSENFNIVGSSILESIATHPKELQPIERILELLFKT